MDLPRYERIWLTVGIGTLVIFLIVTGLLGFYMGLHPADGHGKTIEPESITASAPFNNPGVVEIAPNEYLVTLISHIFAYDPGEIVVPTGSKLHFRATSKDVVHGLYVPGTTVNMMLIPGHVTENIYTFTQPGEYLVLCHEYCGSGHHLMQGRIIVEA